MMLLALLIAHLAGRAPTLGVDPARLGGTATVELDGPNAFSAPLPGLSREERRAFSVGNAFFRDNWVVAPASATGRDGLGPLFNANSCSACHQDDGRGRPPRDASDVGTGLVVFLSPESADGAAHPAYGTQLQDQAIPGVRREAAIQLRPELVRGAYLDGTPYELRSWQMELSDLGYGPLGEVRLSPRIGQQIIGVGLLEAVSDETIAALEDPDDRDGDGISGRAHRVRAPDGSTRIGRFGWKASQPTLEDQVAAALHGDLGLTSPARSHTPLQPIQQELIDAPNGGEPEVDQHKVERIAHYCRVLAVPRQRDALEARVRHGRELFERFGCAACHRPTLVTGAASPIEELRAQVIHPYTDLLLHDMGEGLADHRRDGDASGREWRTPPLWGVGLLGTVNGNAELLHDGRARSIAEAILWHGGEAERSREAFRASSREEREALEAFLQSL